MNTRDISAYIQEIYGINVSAESVSRITDKLIPLINDWKNRGLKDILIVSIDGLNDFDTAITSIFLNTKIQRCVVYQIRTTLKYVNYKDRKAFSQDLKMIYTAFNEKAGKEALEKVKEIWKPKYPYALKSWERNWAQLSSFYEHIEEIKKVMYTINPIENLNRKFRKITKTKGAFPK